MVSLEQELRYKEKQTRERNNKNYLSGTDNREYSQLANKRLKTPEQNQMPDLRIFPYPQVKKTNLEKYENDEEDKQDLIDKTRIKTYSPQQLQNMKDMLGLMTYGRFGYDGATEGYNVKGNTSYGNSKTYLSSYSSQKSSTKTGPYSLN
jgi:hypothetical protein